MVEPLLRRFVAYEKRKEAVIIGTIVAGLVMAWPATDEYIAARKRTQDARLKLEEAEHGIAKLPQFTRLYQQKTQELEALAQQLVGDQAARKLQNDLTELGRRTGCTVLRVQLADPTVRVWKDNDHPVSGNKLKNTGGDTPFQLETRQITLSVTGPMDGLYAFLAGLDRVDKVIYPRSMAMKAGTASARSDDQVGLLDLTLSLFDLTKAAAVDS